MNNHFIFGVWFDIMVLMVEKKRWSRRKKIIIWTVLFVLIGGLTVGGVLWQHNYQQHVAKIKAQDFTVTELTQPSNDIGRLVEQKTGEPLASWQKKNLTKWSFVTAKEAIYVGQALFLTNNSSARQAEKAYTFAEKLANDDGKTYIFYLDYAQTAAAADDNAMIDSLEQKARDAVKNDHSIQDDEKTAIDSYVEMKFNGIRGK